MNTSMALDAYDTIRNLSAFTITGATMRKVNQHVRTYTFPDASELHIFKRGYASATNKLGFIMVTGSIQSNAFGD